MLYIVYRSVCGHNVTIYGPAHFRPVRVTEMHRGDICDFQRWETGEVFYGAVAKVTSPAPGIITVEFDGGGYWDLAASAQARIAGSDAVTRRRIATDAQECIAPDREHNYRATEGNAVYTPDGTLYSIKGGVICSICQDTRRVYELAETERYPLNRELARMHAGRFVPGHPNRITTQPRPVSESYALFALESFGIDAVKILPHGLGVEIPGAGMWEHRATGDMWVTVTTAGRLDGEAGQVYTVTAGQLARIPLDLRLES